MTQVIHRLLTWVLEWCLPATGGRHRAGQPPQPARLDSPAGPARPAHRPRYSAPLDGTATALVRPYLVAHERRQRAGHQQLPSETEWLRQRRERRALYLANRGIYVSSRMVRHHPVRTSAPAPTTLVGGGRG